MPLIGLRPTKARLVMEENRDSVLVMKVVLDDDEAIELSTGGALNDMGGVLRIRERKSNGNGGLGSVVYVASGGDPRTSPAKFQVNVGMSPDKFTTLLRAANAGRLPAKFIVEAGARKGADAKALDYRKRSGVRVKVWDNHAFRVLPVTNFVMILPIGPGDEDRRPRSSRILPRRRPLRPMRGSRSSSTTCSYSRATPARRCSASSASSAWSPSRRSSSALQSTSADLE